MVSPLSIDPGADQPPLGHAPYNADPRQSPYVAWGVYRTVLCIAFLVVGVAYLIWRFGTLNAEYPVFSWLIYLAEIYGLVVASMHVFMVWRLTERQAPPAPPGRSVDVFVTCLNEPVDMLRRTLLLARDMDYAHTTWLLDDGNRPEMRALAERLGVRYLARTDNSHAKAGNLNHALTHSSGELIAVFDSDHAPQKHFLTKTLGYFLDEQVAFVQTPQEFFNLNSFQHRLQKRTRRLWTEQSLFFKVLQRGKDYWNASFFCGTCAVVRRSSLDAIGGFAVGTVTEDLHTSLRMHKAGYRSVYHHEPLAFGIAPAQVSPFLAQRVRWGQGAMQVLRKERIVWTRQLSLAQKINYIASTTTYFDGWQKGIFYLAPAMVLLTGWLPIDTDGWVFLCWFVPYYVLSGWIFEELGHGYGGVFYIEQYNFARFAAFAWATLGLVIGPRKFRVTDKSLSPQSSNRLLFFPQFLVLSLNVLGMLTALVWTTFAPYLPPYALYFNLGWASLNLVCGLAIIGHIRSTERCLRAEYRFPVPLPLLPQATPVQAGKALTIDNISSSGCRLFGALPPNLQRGQLLTGSIVLPSGPLPVHLQAVSAPQPTGPRSNHLYSVGCRFVWDDPEAQDRLDMLLYGNDLQWRLMELQERTTTPGAWLQGLWHKTVKADRYERDWAICEVECLTDPASQLLHGIVPLAFDGQAPLKLVLSAQLAQGTALQLRILTRRGERLVQAKAQEAQALYSTAGTMYVWSLSEVRQSRRNSSASAAPSTQEPPCAPISIP